MRAIKRYVRYAVLFVFCAALVAVVSMTNQPALTGSLGERGNTAFWSGERERININTASFDELCTLPQIGEKRAQAIIDYREMHGDFKSVDELCNVKGIADGILSAVREYITT